MGKKEKEVSRRESRRVREHKGKKERERRRAVGAGYKQQTYVILIKAP